MFVKIVDMDGYVRIFSTKEISQIVKGKDVPYYWILLKTPESEFKVVADECEALIDRLIPPRRTEPLPIPLRKAIL